ncbi:hypothetical protein [Rothia kristinae]|uniref:hypothetical protein n=1 Tax=Rothia kristinae TaxID=37923 RepID=UPI000735E5E0|nr:hypothetical protein [Rothia kristinae]KTR37503.1 hypothetical protein RSA5_07810 [Rothia kristinae]KTR59892.1 hypothetical protein SA11R_02340 [Rothia kristinae]KTR68295.1 hypothetical protein SA12R_05020 [Rothia kristinae]KTR77229.1 hypothetical protein SA14R_06395 [Rothia kristinae]KTR95803.1 hypothetical protein SA13R_01030 [Rothia kristinae]
MASQTAQVIGSGVGMAVLGASMGFSPTLYAVVLHQLNRSPRAATMIRCLALGLGTGTLLLLLLFQVFDPSQLAREVGGAVRRLLTQRNLDLAVGVLFLLAASWEAARSAAPRPPARTGATAQAMTPLGIYLFGALSAGLSTNRILLTYATSRLITRTTEAWPLQLVLVGLLLGALMGPYLLSSWVWNRFPRASGWVRAGFDWLMHWDARVILAVVLLVLGLAFLLLAFPPALLTR